MRSRGLHRTTTVAMWIVVVSPVLCSSQVSQVRWLATPSTIASSEAIIPTLRGSYGRSEENRFASRAAAMEYAYTDTRLDRHNTSHADTPIHTDAYARAILMDKVDCCSQDCRYTCPGADKGMGCCGCVGCGCC